MAVKKVAAKKAPAKKRTTKRTSAGDAFVCGECGLVVTVDQPCTCVDELCDIVCCGVPMKPKKR
ncbi:MAG: hypothetical protein V1767_06100 [Chloroflexota bacterium]